MAMEMGSLGTLRCTNPHRIQSLSPFKSVPYTPKSPLQLPPRFSSAFLGQTLQNKSLIPFKNVSRFRSLSPRAVASDVQAKPTVLVAEKLGEGGLELLRSEANVDCSYNLSQEELCTKISLCDALIVGAAPK
uniref:Uncharacterized protein n=1 Tax=Picea sitchensis TaxID=3332 RepID=A9NXP8_PICSI|nr:unknown [Picea sitchensis]